MCMPMLLVHTVPCPCCMCNMFMLHVHTACPCFISKVYVQAACQCCLSHAACLWNMYILLVYDVPYVCAACPCPCSMSCPCYKSLKWNRVSLIFLRVDRSINELHKLSALFFNQSILQVCFN
jgi:hypothetical protein